MRAVPPHPAEGSGQIRAEHSKESKKRHQGQRFWEWLVLRKSKPLRTARCSATRYTHGACQNLVSERKSKMKHLLIVLLLVLFLVVPANAQTFRGAINGTVTDPSGASVPGAAVKAKNKATAIEASSVTTSDGEFVFQDLAIGTYTVTVTATGFTTFTVDNVQVTQGAIYTLPVKLTLTQAPTVVEVSAAALTLAPTTQTQTTSLSGQDLQTMPLNGRDFSQLVEAVPGYAGYAAGRYGSLHGTCGKIIKRQTGSRGQTSFWDQNSRVKHIDVF